MTSDRHDLTHVMLVALEDVRAVGYRGKHFPPTLTCPVTLPWNNVWKPAMTAQEPLVTVPQYRSVSRLRCMTAGVLVQVAEVLEQSEKWVWLQSRLSKFIDDGDVLVFASTQARVDELTAQLQGAGIKCASACHVLKQAADLRQSCCKIQGAVNM